MSAPVDVSKTFEAQGYKVGPNLCAVTCLTIITGLALFIIGCVGAAGAFPGSTIGWVTVGLAGGGFALNLSLGNLKNRKIDVIFGGLMAAALVTVGALGGAGVLSATQVGWGILGTTFASIPFKCLLARKVELIREPAN